MAIAASISPATRSCGRQGRFLLYGPLIENSGTVISGELLRMIGWIAQRLYVKCDFHGLVTIHLP